MINNSWYKKERPLLALQGFGGGSVGPLMGGASSPKIEASGGFQSEKYMEFRCEIKFLKFWFLGSADL